MVTGKRQFLAKLALKSGITKVTNILAPSSLTIFGYHRVGNPGQYHATDLDETLFGPDADEFERQLLWLQLNTTILTQSDLLDCIAGRARLPKRATMITFDDGYLDNFEVAAPILDSLGIKATFFVTTSMIDDGSLGWWEHVSFAINRSKKKIISLRDHKFYLPMEFGQARDFCNNLFKLQPEHETKNLLLEIYEACGVDVFLANSEKKQTMNWEQVKSLSDRGHTIGSHTCTHRVLATIPREEQRQELLNSKMIISKKIGADVASVAFPVGANVHYTQSTVHLAEECGYSLAFTFDTGINRGIPFSPYEVSRVSAPNTTELMSAHIVSLGLI